MARYNGKVPGGLGLQLVPEVVSIQVVTMECGICEEQYEVQLLLGDVKMVACPGCDNRSLQMLVGTE